MDKEYYRNLRERIDSLLSEYTGVLWEEARGDVHMQFNEIPNWVLIKDECNLESAIYQTQLICKEIAKIDPNPTYTFGFYKNFIGGKLIHSYEYKHGSGQQT